MIKVFEAIYEDGVLKPLEDPGLQDHQRVRIEIQQENRSTKFDPFWRNGAKSTKVYPTRRLTRSTPSSRGDNVRP